MRYAYEGLCVIRHYATVLLIGQYVTNARIRYICCTQDLAWTDLTLIVYLAKLIKLMLYNGCVRLASLGHSLCVAGFFSRTFFLHTFVLEKKHVTHRGRPREAKRTHPNNSDTVILALR